MSQVLRHSRGKTPSLPNHRPKVPKTAAEQDEAVKIIAKIELEQLEAQQEDVVKSDPTDSSDEASSLSRICHHMHMIERPVAPTQLHHSCHRQTPLASYT